MDKTFHFVISGRVQGVFFRLKTRQQADMLGVTGWVMNRPDGRVEGVASGDEEALEEFKRWLSQGPELARVLRVECAEWPVQEYNGFQIR
ncbi:MAG: acylphosphatase [Gammaproteobacteria bacterium]